jgi:ribosomal protein S18 acetylase RimI-like enzyme
MRLRPAALDDAPFLVRMLHEACLWNPEWERWPIEEIMTDDHLRRYIEVWGREGDAAVIATDEAGRRVGAAWYRLFSEEEPGYGFVDSRTPELSIAVLPEWRRRGVGRALLNALKERAKSEGFPALSLSVSTENPAVSLYERLGFEKVALIEGNWTMVATLSRDLFTDTESRQ